MRNDQFEKLKNRIARKSVVDIVLYSLGASLLLAILVDGIYNDEIANRLFRMNADFYYWCVRNKMLFAASAYLILFALSAFLVIRKANNKLVEIISAMDQVLKEPEKDIKLSDDLVILKNRLNNIRVDLITNQTKAKEAETKKNDLIMYMAHDLKTPLTSVIGYLSLLTEETQISKKLQTKYLKIALSKALRLEELTNQFFDITRYHLQDIPITKQKLDLVFLMAQLVEEAYPMLQEKKLECVIDKPKSLEFQGDGDKLARAFGNLLKNAVSYSYENTVIKIEITEEKEKIKIGFKNKGDKIPAYKLDKLFDKFYRLDESRTSSTGGAGLGLAITKEIVELHGGEIFVKNEEEWIEFWVEFQEN